MTVSEIQEALRLADSALRSAREAEKYTAAIVGGDRSGYASHAYTKAKQAVQDLERLRRQLQAVRAG
ncbi:hypothetical protein ASG32_30725 [Methylobacterium sp. Leaf361]|nr:hypothetical protein ASG32_30725 [Methylobacterium sp. Leaf361]